MHFATDHQTPILNGKTEKIDKLKVLKSGIIEIGTKFKNSVDTPTVTTAYGGIVALRKAFDRGDFVGEAKREIEDLLKVLE